MTVVRRETRRRWLVVLAAVALLVALPGVVAAWPSRTPRLDAGLLRDRIRASAGQAHQGYAESAGALGLPELPRLGQVTSLLSGTTRMRTWYAEPQRWRVDVIDTGSERGLYQTSDGQYFWDYGANQLTFVAASRPTGPGDNQVTGAAGQPTARLPRAADLMPPELARRLLSMAEGDEVRSIDGRRVAGVAAAGLRITSRDPIGTVGRIDIWADPRTGLPLEVEVVARGAERPILVSRFLDVELSAPTADTLAPPAPQGQLSFTATQAADAFDAVVDRDGPSLPDRLVGLALRDPMQETAVRGRNGRMRVVWLNPIGVYGAGLSRIVVVPLSSRVGADAFDRASAWGQRMTFPFGTGALLATPILAVMIIQLTMAAGQTYRIQSYLVAGMVSGELLQRAGAELAGSAT